MEQLVAAAFSSPRSTYIYRAHRLHRGSAPKKRREVNPTGNHSTVYNCASLYYGCFNMYSVAVAAVEFADELL